VADSAVHLDGTELQKKPSDFFSAGTFLPVPLHSAQPAHPGAGLVSSQSLAHVEDLFYIHTRWRDRHRRHDGVKEASAVALPGQC
jgi:hypothetical protein